MNCSVAFFQSLSAGSSPANVKAAVDRKLAPDFTLTDAPLRQAGAAIGFPRQGGAAELLARRWNPCAVEIPWFVELQSQSTGMTWWC